MNLVLKVKKQSQRENLISFAIFMPFTFGLLIDGLGFPNIIKYSVDVAWIILLFFMIISRMTLPNKESKGLLWHTLCFGLITLVGAVVAFQSPLYYFWGFRNNFRFFILFFACVMYLRKENAGNYLRIFDWLFYINFPVCLYQYFGLGLRMDYLGGIFGVHTGSNGTTLVFFSIVISKSILEYMSNREPLILCALKCGMALIVAVVAELKVFFLLLILIISFSAVVTKFSVKKYVIALLVLIAVPICANMLGSIFENFSNWFNLERILAMVSSERGYTGNNDVNRLTGIPIVWKRFLTTWWKKLWGLGLGNCDTSAFAFLNTPFYARYRFLHYNWFSGTFMILETGIIGLICYCSFFVRVALKSVAVYRTNKHRELECRLAELMSIISLVLIIYNASLRTEAGYMVYFVLALPFINDRTPNR